WPAWAPRIRSAPRSEPDGPVAEPWPRRRSVRGTPGRIPASDDGSREASARARVRRRLGKQRLKKRPRGRACPLAWPDGKGANAPIAGDDEGRRQTHHTVRGIDLAVGIENEREGQAELTGVPAGRCSVFTRLYGADGEPFRRKLAVEPLEHGHLGPTLRTPARPEVHEHHFAAEVLHRESACVDRASAEVRRGGPGGVAGEIERLEKRRHRRVGSREAARRNDEQRQREPPRAHGFSMMARMSRRSVSLYTTSAVGLSSSRFLRIVPRGSHTNK